MLFRSGTVNVVGTASGSGGQWYLTGVQLEAGSVATPFEFRHYSTELELCQRYYEVQYFHWRVGYSGYAYNTHPWRVVKRTDPTVTNNVTENVGFTWYGASGNYNSITIYPYSGGSDSRISVWVYANAEL